MSDEPQVTAEDFGYQEWLQASTIIEGFLRQICPHYHQEANQHNARAILARLAQHKPPLLVSYSTRVMYSDREQEIARLRATLERIASAAGMPDAAEGCRVVLELVKEVRG